MYGIELVLADGYSFLHCQLHAVYIKMQGLMYNGQRCPGCRCPCFRMHNVPDIAVFRKKDLPL